MDFFSIFIMEKMAIKLDDFLSKKKEVAPILDLSKCTANSKEELKKLLEKVPEFRTRPEKIKPEDIKIREKDFTFKTPKRELKPPSIREYQFVDPVPAEMRGVRLEDLSSVNIPWKMLTTLRPKNKLEDEFFSRLVELGKLRLQTEEREKRISATDFVRKMKSKAGIVETRVVSCKECGEEFCAGEACHEFLYEAFVREDPSLAAAGAVVGGGKGAGGDDEEKGRGRSRKKKRRAKSRVVTVMGGGATSSSRARDKSRSKSKATRDGRKSKSRDGRKGGSGSRGRKSSKSRDRKSSKSGDRSKKKVRKKKKKKKKEEKEKMKEEKGQKKKKKN
ncbi:micronuclear linker histone polyprotein-like [Nilaparvata lugens]|uniref:micronuclear linker histone polyprotein-like n=1 Tax=Nilaparvata lugens TaxID=108931 RepID=UPI00193C96D1|nr:micronuclear linker histone polyprotein-like [Nilaparvata lugens]